MGEDTGGWVKSRAYDSRKAILIDISILVLFWIFAVVVVNPSGNFPLNDDWTYGKTVKLLLETGKYRPLGWSNASLISHVLWGTLFCLPFGFSFEALRFSTLLLGLAGVIGTYFLLTEVKASRYYALICALVVAANPLYLSLSFTFMTDIPFTFVSLLSFIFFAKFLTDDSVRYFVFGVLFMELAVLCRQIGLFIPLAFAITILIRDRTNIRSLFCAFIPVVLGITSPLILEHYLTVHHALPVLYGSKCNEAITAIFKIFSGNNLPVSFLKSLIIILYLGLFILPLLPSLPNPFVHSKKGMIFLAAVILACHNIFSNVQAPGNVLTVSGIGPPTLYDTFILKLHHLPAINNNIVITITVMGLIGAGWILALLYREFKRRNTVCNATNNYPYSLIIIFALLACIIYITPLLLIDSMFDRYLVPLISFMCCIMVLSIRKDYVSYSNIKRRIMVGASVALISLYAFVGIAGTRDYLAWNRVRWDALQTLMKKNGIPASQIDGGYEFNGWFLYDPSYPTDFRRTDKSWWWVRDNKYLVTFGPVSGYRQIAEYDYFRILPPQRAKLLVLKRQDKH